jgi:hypothetical protein
VSARALSRFAALLIAFLPAACATQPRPRQFAPASADTAREALASWAAASERAAALPASRLLYDASMSSGVASLPGTLAVTYDGRRVERASLTGPFGSTVAEYAAGTITGQDRKAFLVDPEALRAVLTGSWPGAPSGVAGCDGAECLLVWNGTTSVEAVVEVPARLVRSLVISGSSGRLAVSYSGGAEPWPERIAVRDARTSRSLTLRLVAVEPASPATPGS